MGRVYRNLNVPNLIGFARLLLLFPFIFLLLTGRHLSATILFSIMAIMDKIDGIVARRMNMVTKFGAGLDSSIDWIIMSSTFVALLYAGIVDLVWLYVLLPPLVLLPIVKYAYYRKTGATHSNMVAKFSGLAIYLSILSILIFPQTMFYAAMSVSVFIYANLIYLATRMFVRR